MRRSNRRRGGALALWISIPALALATGALTVLAVLARRRPYFSLDVKVTRAVQAVDLPGYDPLMNTLCWIGYPPQVIYETGLIIIALWLARRRWEAAVMTLMELEIAFAGYALKMAVNRPRPSPDMVRVAKPDLDGGTLSFPAGHVQGFLTAFGFLAFLLAEQKPRSSLQSALLGVFVGLMILIGPSRLYEGEHWLSDVLGGYLFGFISLALAIRLYLATPRVLAPINPRLTRLFEAEH